MKRFLVLLPILITLAGLAVLFRLPARDFQPAQAAVYALDRAIVVNTLQDEWNSDGDCSLREAVAAANINAAVDACPAGQVLTDTITFSVAGTITVTSQLAVTAGGPLVIDGGEVITTSGGGTTRVWMVEVGSHLTLQSLAVVNGYVIDDGGGIANRGILVITDSTLSNNSVCWGGISACEGGGIFNYDTGTLSIANSTFSGNIGGNGGGIYNDGMLSITNSTFSGNVAYGFSDGGGIYNEGVLSIANSTFSANFAEAGNGIYGSAVLTNTIVANSLSGGDCFGTITDGGHNLDSDGTCGFDPAKGSLPNTDPMLGPLQDNGGPTWTHALLFGSPAIDAGDNAQCTSTDQRGVPRPMDGDFDGDAVCDMGAYEFQQRIFLNPPTPSGSGALGVNVDYTIQLHNWTGLNDTYSLALGTHAWETTLSTETLGPLPPNGSQAFTATVLIPPDANWYEADTVVITATSNTSPTVYAASAQVTTQAYAPPQISIEPPSLESTQDAGEIVTQVLTIHNENGVTLTYEINEISYDDAVLLLHLDEAAGSTYFQDASGWNNHGTCSGISCPASGFAGNAGQAVLFDGIDDFIQAPTNGFPTGNSDRTMAAWVKVTSVVAGEGTIVGYGNFGTGSQAYILHIGHTNLTSICFTQWQGYVCGPQLQPGKWYHVAVTNIGNLISLYVDGMQVASGNLPMDIPGGTQFVMGRLPPSSGVDSRFNGYIDEVAIFDRALAPAEIMALYQAGNGGDGPWLTVDPVSGTVPPNASRGVTVTFDATNLQPDVYAATRFVLSNDPLSPPVGISVPFTMTVEPNPYMGWVEGYVTDLHTGQPLEATIIALEQPYTVTSDAKTGYYRFWLEPGTYILQVSAAGYVTQAAVVTVTTQQGEPRDFSLQPLWGEVYLPSLLKDQSVGSYGSIRIVSDGNWRMSGIYLPGWETVDFDDSDWEYVAAPAPVSCGWDHCIFNQDILTMWAQTQYVTIYLRKSFEIPANIAVTSASISSLCDDDHDVYINGILVSSDWDWWAGPLVTTDITNYLQTGTNVIAIKASDTRGVCRHICVDANIRYVYKPPD